MNCPSSLKLFLRIVLPFKAEELGLKYESCKNADVVKVRTNLAHCHLGMVFSCPQWHRAACWETLHTIGTGQPPIAASADYLARSVGLKQ